MSSLAPAEDIRLPVSNHTKWAKRMKIIIFALFGAGRGFTKMALNSILLGWDGGIKAFTALIRDDTDKSLKNTSGSVTQRGSINVFHLCHDRGVRSEV